MISGGNVVTGCAGVGIYSDPTSQHSVVTGNTSVLNTTAQILVDVSSHQNSVKFNNAGDDLIATAAVGQSSPEGIITALPGSIYLRQDGGSGTTLYVKESGSGNTGWTGISG